jgi:type II secretory pathway component PulJ
MMNSEFRTKEKGFTLIELLIYAALSVIIGLVVVVVFLQVVNVVESSRRSRESLDNAKRAMDVIVQEIKHAEGIYTPTSAFDINPGQLSLETKRDADFVDEESTYVDFYVDDDRLYMKRESQAAQLVISEKVKVEELIFTRLNIAGDKSAVRVKIRIAYADPIAGPTSSVTLYSTAALRAY